MYTEQLTQALSIQAQVPSQSLGTGTTTITGHHAVPMQVWSSEQRAGATDRTWKPPRPTQPCQALAAHRRGSQNHPLQRDQTPDAKEGPT